MSDTKTCERCGEEFQRNKKRPRAEFAKRRFCCRKCGVLTLRRPGKRLTHCRSGEHEMTGANVRTRINSDGYEARSCKACAAARDAQRRPSKAPRGPRRPRPVAKPAVPAPPPVAVAPVWRPPGWSATPRI